MENNFHQWYVVAKFPAKLGLIVGIVIRNGKKRKVFPFLMTMS